MAAKTSKAPVDYNQDHEQKLKALDVALTQIEKNFGKGSIMKLGESAANLNIETVIYPRNIIEKTLTNCSIT